MSDPYLRFQSVTKTFPGVRALDGVSFGARRRSVHALIGENGAGKSTLLKILSGAYVPTSGALSLDGQVRTFSSTRDAIAAGVAVIYQELHLVPEVSVAENLYLGHLPNRWGVVRKQELLSSARALLRDLGEEIEPGTKLRKLSIAQRQMVEIAKALSHDATVIAFDEPTSSFSGREVARLFEVIRRLRDEGRVVLYVSHRMDEIFDLCDAATVLRDGQHIETMETLQGVTQESLVRAMVGRSIQDIFHYTAREHGATALEVDAMIGPGLEESVSLSVAQGEIVGIFGLVGAGRTELLKLIYGATPAASGTVRVEGRNAAIDSPRRAIRSGIVLCPEDRKHEGIVGVRSVMENVNLSGRRHHARFGMVINESWERENAARHVKALGIKTPSLTQLIAKLSGGNQQKVVLARWLSEQIKVVLLDEPTRGIDVGAKSEIYSIIYDLARRGVAVVVVSSELPEVLGICDRILVMRQGRLVAELPRAEATQEHVLALALPVDHNALQQVTG